MLSVNDTPKCVCLDEYVGDQCEVHEACVEHCHNDGQCYVIDKVPHCKCKPQYRGLYCEIRNEKIEDGGDNSAKLRQGSKYITSFLFALLFLFLVLVTFVAGFVIIKKRKIGKPFTHTRLQDDNMEISNPMYLNDMLEDIEPFDGSNFSFDADNVSFSSFDDNHTNVYSR